MERLLTFLLLALSAVLITRPAFAVEPEFQITPRAGVGTLRVDALAAVNEQDVSVDTLCLGAAFGYLTPVGVVAEAGVDSFDHFSLFGTSDSFSLTNRFVAVGYQLDFGNGWRFVPKVGRARWRLESTEGWLFNPGEEERRDTKGYDTFWEVSVARRVSKIVTLGLSHRQGQYDFGRTGATTFVVTLGF